MTRHAPGFTLVEAVVALVVVATGVVASQRLLAQSARTVAAERAATRAQLAAQDLLAEARHGALPIGRIDGTDATGIRYERDVRPTDHPALRTVQVRTQSGSDAGSSCELVEILRVPNLP
jgi:type II secretory pathway pseudopilin PulG